MDDAFIPLLWCGSIGWFLLTYSLGLGGSKSAARVLVWTVFYWFIALDCVAMVLGIAAPFAHRFGVGWSFVSFFVVPPYLLCALRLRWLRRRHRIPVPPSPSTPAA